MAVADLLVGLRSVLDSDARVEAAFLFGSAARDALRDDSDVDVGVRWASDAARMHAVREFLDIVGRQELVRATIEVIDWEYARRVRRASLATRLGATDG